MVENLILIGIGFVLGGVTAIVVLYVGGKAVMSRKIDRMNTNLDRAQKMLDDTEPPDPERLIEMMREVEDLPDDLDESPDDERATVTETAKRDDPNLEDPFDGISPESS